MCSMIERMLKNELYWYGRTTSVRQPARKLYNVIASREATWQSPNRNHMNPTEQHYKLLKALDQNPNASQQELSAELGMSLVKVNYCLKALVQVGWVKMDNSMIRFL